MLNALVRACAHSGDMQAARVRVRVRVRVS